MPPDISRRGFLKAGAAAAAGAALTAAKAPRAEAAPTGAELLTVFDLEKCIGCEACVDACRETWQPSVLEPQGPMPQPIPAKVPIEDWSQKKDVSDRLTPYNFLYVEHLDLEHKGRSLELHVPRRCMHCLNPPCTNLCPFGAGRREDNGIVHIDDEICLGGAKCRTVCPWHIPQRQSGVGIYLDLMPTLAGNGVMYKCHRCLPLVAKGETPRCVEICPEQVQSIGPREEMKAKAIALAKEKAVADGAAPERYGEYLYGLEENGGTGTIYVSPVPLAVLAAAVDQAHQGRGSGQGKGKGGPGGGKGLRMRSGLPHMRPVANAMAKEENLGWAVLAAPVAGLAAGFLGLFSAARGKGKEGQS